MLLHNCPALHHALHQESCPGHTGLDTYGVVERSNGSLYFNTNEEATYPVGFCAAYAPAESHALREWTYNVLPQSPEDREGWLRQQLAQATARLQQFQTQEEAVTTIITLLDHMVPGLEHIHMEHMLRLVDFKGGDVRLDVETTPGSKQDFPYPAFAWDWSTTQAYAWSQSQHINILEVLACLNAFKGRLSDRIQHNQRFLHVCDSRVACAVICKGRSSSKRLNHVLRKILGLSLATNSYPLMLWTISQWMPFDRGSRLHHRKEQKDDG